MTIAIWLLLLFVSWLAATISGIAGFGGFLIILHTARFFLPNRSQESDSDFNDCMDGGESFPRRVRI